VTGSTGAQLRRIVRLVWGTLGLLVMLWLFVSVQAHGVDPRFLTDDAKVTVAIDGTTLRFTPRQRPQSVGFLFYPGSLVDPKAYAPLAHALAAQGFTTIIVKLPLRTAPLASQEAAVMARTQAIMQEDETVTRWVVGGHSRGGAIAARYAHAQPTGLAGLILIGTSHPKEAAFDLSGSPLKVMKIFASNDGLASVAEVEENSRFLPADTQWVRIEGGNHAQFGYYGSQLGDSRATISRQEQQTQTVAAIQTFLTAVGAAE